MPEHASAVPEHETSEVEMSSATGMYDGRYVSETGGSVTVHIDGGDDSNSRPSLEGASKIGPLPEGAYRLPEWQIVEGTCEGGLLKGTVHTGPYGREMVLSYALEGASGSPDARKTGTLRLKASDDDLNRLVCWMANGEVERDTPRS